MKLHALSALLAATLLAAAGAGAAPVSTVHTAASATVSVPPGATVTVNGAVVQLRQGTTTGTYNCRCSDTGACAIKQDPSILTCQSDTKSPCKGSCEMSTTTNPHVSAAAAAAAARSNTGLSRAPN